MGCTCTGRLAIFIIQTVLVFLAWLLTITALCGNSSDYDVMKNTAWQQNNDFYYANFWGRCESVFKKCVSWDKINGGGDRADKQDTLIAMAALSFIFMTVFMITTPMRINFPVFGNCMAATNIGSGLFTWLWLVIAWGLYADNFGNDSLDYGPGFNAAVAAWVFVNIALLLACAGSFLPSGESAPPPGATPPVVNVTATAAGDAEKV